MDELKKAVDPALVSETERYDFRWYGKTRSKREAFTPSRAALVYDPARSVNPAKAGGNMIIEGENLEVLKLLTAPTASASSASTSTRPTTLGKIGFTAMTTQKSGSLVGNKQKSAKMVSSLTQTPKATAAASTWLSMMHSRLLTPVLAVTIRSDIRINR